MPAVLPLLVRGPVSGRWLTARDGGSGQGKGLALPVDLLSEDTLRGGHHQFQGERAAVAFAGNTDTQRLPLPGSRVSVRSLK